MTITTSKPSRKFTAANTPILAAIKKQMNHLVYAKAISIWNADGELACQEYMGQHFNDDYRERCLASLGFTVVAPEDEA